MSGLPVTMSNNQHTIVDWQLQNWNYSYFKRTFQLIEQSINFGTGNMLELIMAGSLTSPLSAFSWRLLGTFTLCLLRYLTRLFTLCTSSFSVRKKIDRHSCAWVTGELSTIIHSSEVRLSPKSAHIIPKSVLTPVSNLRHWTVTHI